MLVCWDWLSQYLHLEVSPDDLAHRLAMSGLNHESTTRVGVDTVIDLEVTSNRSDCLGHIGIAREAAVLLHQPLSIPNPNPAEDPQAPVSKSISVANYMTAACPRYTARVIRGVKVGPSPTWLARRLESIGIKSINKVVDVTNYVMLECGQPLHAFDLKSIRGSRIIVRPAQTGEQFLAIDHRTYTLDSSMVVIADAERAVALGGVMGGADSEVSTTTTNLLIEAAAFHPLSIRSTARKLKLHSPSSFRFERKPDPAGLDWASRRCCEMILELCGGRLCSSSIDTGAPPIDREPVRLRLAQIRRILGTEIPAARVREILSALGCRIEPSENADIVLAIPPSWRADIFREIDLIEEVARIHGYDKIPENVVVPVGIAVPRRKDIVLTKARYVLGAFGVDEALTPSIVQNHLDDCGSLWTNSPALVSETPLLEGAKTLRRSLLPSLLEARRTNQSLSIHDAQLYEVANIYLAADTGLLPRELSVLGIVTTGDLSIVKGVVEQIVEQVAAKSANLSSELIDHPVLEAGSGLQYRLAGRDLGYVGLVSQAVRQKLGLDVPAACAELLLDTLSESLVEVRRADPISPFPAILRDLNFIVDEHWRWSDLQGACSESGGSHLRAVHYGETYRDTKKDGAGKKRVLVKLLFQSFERTLTSQEVDQAVNAIVARCVGTFSAKLVD